MVKRAIANAKFHGINVRHGSPNKAQGNCAFEAVADNISVRPCFEEVLSDGDEVYRREWLEETEDLVFNFCGGAGMLIKDFQREWNLLKEPGNYEYALADYILPTIAHCTQKDILIFNTELKGTFDPIFVVEASSLGGRSANSRIPVLLAYNQFHYESLIPNTQEDELLTIQLKESYLFI